MSESNKQIQATFKMLEDWDCLNHLTDSEKKTILSELKRIKSEAIYDINSKIGDAVRELSK